MTTGEVHRRVHVKPDGRRLYLYGWRRHDLPVWAEPVPAPQGAPHLRWHPLRAEWVAYASHRQDRTFKPAAADCPLCPAKPETVPGEIPFEDFEIAVFENRFPAFAAEAPTPPAGLPVVTGAAAGACEVVVFSAAHTGSLATLDLERRALLVRVWADRCRELLARPDIRVVLPFENRGEEVGVTLHHPHGQIYAFPFLPPVLATAVAAFRREPLLTAVQAQTGSAYQIAGDAWVTALVPPFARFPNEVWIMTRAAHPGPWSFSDQEVTSFAAVLGETVARLDGLYARPMPYVAALYTAPKGEEHHFHAHLQLTPFLRTADRLKYLAGCELAAGTFLVDGLPEQMAERLRQVRP